MPNGQTPDKSRRWHDGSALVISDRDEMAKPPARDAGLFWNLPLKKSFTENF